MFIGVAEAGSFAEAARRLGVPANTLSRRVQGLEDRLGIRLLHRTTRQLSLTNAGKYFFERCSGSIREISAAAKQILESKEAPAGTFRISAPAGFFNSEWIAEFLSEHNQVRLEFTLSESVVDLVAEGIDLAFREGRLRDSSLVVRKIEHAYGVLVASPVYLQKRGMPHMVEALSDHDCIVISPSISRAGWSLSGPNGCVEFRPRARLSMDNHKAMTSAALTGAGIALIPALLAADHLREGHLVHVLPQYRRESGGLYAIYPSRRHPPLAVSLFVDFIAQRLDQFWKERDWATPFLVGEES